MSIYEVKIFKEPPPKPAIPVIPVTYTPPHYSRDFRYDDTAPEMTGEDVPWYKDDPIHDLKKEIHDASNKDVLSRYTCKACGVIPSQKDRRYVIKAGRVHLVCSAKCVDIIKNTNFIIKGEK